MEEQEYYIQIAKPDDSGDYLPKITLMADRNYFGSRFNNINSWNPEKKDPVHHSLCQFWRKVIKNVKSYDEAYLEICGVPLLLENPPSKRLSLNGKTVSMEHLVNCLARLTYKASTNTETRLLHRTLKKYLRVHEDIRYVVENRLSFHFFSNFERHDVKLNVTQINSEEYAIEVSDGIWGTMKSKDLVSFCKFFLHGKKQTKWSFCSPVKLFTETVGREPTNAEKELITPFLLQNRTLNLIEDRAKQLVLDLKKEYPEKIFLTFDEEDFLKIMYVRGKEFDWKLETSHSKHVKKTGRQAVKTYFWNHRCLLSKIELKENPPQEGHWQGPICIDNMSKDTPLGDQFAARAFAVMNDSALRKMVFTVRDILPTKVEEYARFDFDSIKEKVI